MIVDLALNNGCTVFTAPDSGQGFVSLFPLGGSMFLVQWHESQVDAAQANSTSMPGSVVSGFWEVYPGAGDCDDLAGIEPVGFNLSSVAAEYPADYDAANCMVAPGEIFMPPPPKQLIVKWGELPAEKNTLDQVQLVCISRKNTDEPSRYAWISGVPNGGGVDVSLFSIDGRDVLNPDDFLISKCC